MKEVELGLKIPDPKVVVFCCKFPKGVANGFPKGAACPNGEISFFASAMIGLGC